MLKKSHLLAWIIGFIPLVWEISQALTGGYGANPIETAAHQSGRWGIWFLLATLTISPLVRLSKLKQIFFLRRTLGLLSFFYLTVHMFVFVGLEQFFDFSAIMADIIKRPYITLGLTGFTLLIPLALTSTIRSRHRLGRWWRRIHLLVFPATIAGLVHHLWLVKADWYLPALHIGIFSLLMLLRMLKS
ncbi:MAG: sulfoxide reductase heme-binding subunit YedZ [Magnetococcales bacterium]|nr:sulfoxide reductase heme-binding subunit YedZ [Magnetococcales bacterium]